MSTPKLWKFYCKEDEYPGQWRLWLTRQCVAVSYSPKWAAGGGKARWRRTKKVLDQIKEEDIVVAALPGRRIGRLGTVIRKEIETDQWDALVPPTPEEEEGLFGRRILVRWDLEHCPDDLDMAVRLPEGFGFNTRETRYPVALVKSQTTKDLEKVMADPANWVGLVGRFGYERALSDYIALYPHRLEDGLMPYPNEKVRERVFKNKSRLDVLLRDKYEKPVIVECKQESPTVENIKQLLGYMRRAKEVTHESARGILVHGGALKVDRKAWKEARSHGIRIYQYKLDVDFAPSCG